MRIVSGQITGGVGVSASAETLSSYKFRTDLGLNEEPFEEQI
jgi:hypothetical protein